MHDGYAGTGPSLPVSVRRRRLVLEARALTGRWHVTSHLRRDRPAWPPAPDTAFSALVAAAAAAGDACDPALRWVETLEFRAVEAELEPGWSAALVYVPVPDRTPWEKGAWQPRHVCSIGSDEPVRWSWALPDDAPPGRLQRLAKIAAGITHIGASRGPVLAHVAVSDEPLPDDALVPVAGGPVLLRTPYPGRLDELEVAYLRGIRPRPAPERAYAPLADVLPCTKTGQNQLRRSLSSPWAPMIALRKTAGPRLDLSATVPLCAALRRSLLAHLGDNASAALTGHDGCDAPTDAAHLAVVPLARVGDGHADGEVRGLGLLAPQGLAEVDHAALVATLGRWLGQGGTLSLGSLRWQLAIARPDVDRKRLPVSLQPERYTRSARCWATVTPVAFDRHPKWHEDGRSKRDRSIPALVASMRRAVGLPPPSAATVLPEPGHVGAAPRTDHLLDGRAYLARAFVAHLRVSWRQPVPGPILLGRGRHFRLGLTRGMTRVPRPRREARRGVRIVVRRPARSPSVPLDEPAGRALCRRDAAAGTLPPVIALPTAAGKSEIVLIWAWTRGVSPALPRRLWIASDRRLLVDQAFEAARLLEGDGIRVSRLRGGLAQDDDPRLGLLAPQVISTTIDQFGSRLLFRGYGVTSRDWPIHAALAGSDSLVVLDEAHLSPDAEDVFRACIRFGAELKLVSKTATPRNPGEAFALDAADRAHPVLGPRLAVRRLVEPRSKGTLAEAGRELLATGARRIALVANTVRAARAAFEALSDIPEDEVELHLLIGRQRPLDRDRILANVLPRIRSGAARPEHPIVVVTTQAIEAGADLDFEAMASEGCPIDALIQRLGRLDRLGTAGVSRCLLLKPDRFEPPYGEAPLKTFAWINKHARKSARGAPRSLDLGPAAWQRLAAEASDELYASLAEPTSLLAPHLRMLTWRSPRPAVEPDIDLLLHGRERGGGTVSVIWRRDVEPEEPEAATEVLRLVPPSALEACPVPTGELRLWLLGRSADADAGDVEGARHVGEAPETNVPPRAQRVLRWNGREDGGESVVPGELRSGDMVILPAALGGYDAHGWAPNATDAVPDIAEAALWVATGRRLLRSEDAEIDVAQIGAVIRATGPEGAPHRRRVTRWSHGTVVELVPRGKRIADPTREVPLVDHSLRVAARAAELAGMLGLSPEVLHRAELHHDDCKADRRWQIAIRGGDVSRLGGPNLAKGPYRRTPLDRLPRGCHEAESLALLDAKRALADLRDESELVRHLVASHHGHARPLWPELSDGQSHGPGLAELQDRLQARYGPWRLALYEAALRLSDRAVSREEAEGCPETPVPCPARSAAVSRALARPSRPVGTSSFAPAFDPLNLRDVMAAIGLTRLVSECSDGATFWRVDHGRYRFRIEGVPADLARNAPTGSGGTARPLASADTST